MTDYTGPTNIIEHETGFHIEGYPDAARYVQLDTILFRRLADLRMHQSALRLCEAGMQAFGALEDKRSDGARLMLTGVVASFFSCFGQNNASLSLSSGRVFKGNADAKSAYNYWKALRNKLIIHNESGYCTQIGLCRYGCQSLPRPHFIVAQAKADDGSLFASRTICSILMVS
jgi:hypothetical protein